MEKLFQIAGKVILAIVIVRLIGMLLVALLTGFLAFTA